MMWVAMPSVEAKTVMSRPCSDPGSRSPPTNPPASTYAANLSFILSNGVHDQK